MPFDGESFLRTKDGIAAEVIDRILELLGKNGRNWLQGDWEDGNKRCLVQALVDACEERDAKEGPNARYIRMAIDEIRPISDWEAVEEITDFNDTVDFEHVKYVLERAKEIATDAIPFATMKPLLWFGEAQRTFEFMDDAV
jgi:hypothetical protein